MRNFSLSINGEVVGHITINEAVVKTLEEGTTYDLVCGFIQPQNVLVEIGLVPNLVVSKKV